MNNISTVIIVFHLVAVLEPEKEKSLVSNYSVYKCAYSSEIIFKRFKI